MRRRPSTSQAEAQLLTSVVTAFVENAQKTVLRLRRDAEAGYLEAFENTVHHLKESRATVGAGAFAEACRRIERAVRQGQQDVV